MMLEISSILAGGKNLRLQEGSDWDVVGDGTEEILRRRLDTLSEKKEVKHLASRKYKNAAVGYDNDLRSVWQ